jgi:methyl-accepting chemotaxis protein
MMATTLLASLNHVPISKKLPMMIAVVGVLSCIVTGVMGSLASEQALMKQAQQKLGSSANSQVTSLKGYLESIESDLKAQAASPFVRQALLQYNDAFHKVADPKTFWQELYINSNPNELGQKHKLDFAPDGSPYSQLHAQYHPWLRTFLESKGYYDIFIINKQGDVVYTVFKELDFATNLADGDWKDSDMGALFKDIVEQSDKDTIVYKDFRPYAPSHDIPASFIGHRITDAQGNFLGVLAFQMPIEKLNGILQKDSGLGKTGQTYLLGTDLKMRTDSKFTKKGETDILKTQMPKAFQGGFKKDNATFEAVTGKSKKLIGTHRLDFEGTHWLVAAEQGLDELKDPVKAMQVALFLQILVLAALGTLAGAWIAGSISKPLQHMVKVMESLAKGNTQLEIPGQDRGDEVGLMSKTVQVFRENAIQKNKLSGRLMQLADQLEESVKTSLTTMLKQTQNLEEVATQMSQGANTTISSIEQVSYSSSQMSEAASEISSQVSHSHIIVQQASEGTEEAKKLMTELSESSQHIGEVVTLIRSITDQTNLLALNATIEASRAGEAGKGFAVVASEVKELAAQTASATEEVNRQISTIQTESDHSAMAINEIANVIDQVSASSRSIAAAVEEQTCTLVDISNNLNQVVAEANQFKSITESVTSAATQLGQQAKSVDTLLDSFLQELRSGGGR